MKHLLILTLALFCIQLSAQTIPADYFRKNGEIYFRFPLQNRTIMNDLAKIISLDAVKNDSVYAYANQSEYHKFLNYSIPYSQLPHPGDVPAQMSSVVEDVMAWNTYPTYEAYVQMMYQFQTNYPFLCRIIDAGTTVDGRKILFAKISDNVDAHEPEPRFMYSSTIHGDETTGYVLMLRLIDSLLTSYGNNSRITNLINNVEIWINPNANPDGTYYSGNSSVSGARRYNRNSIDINRNFPDPADGPHPDGSAWQPETIAMTQLLNNRHFVMSANFHGGVEVLNYPWDTWSRRHADDAWFIKISRQYVDTVHKYSPSSYMTYLNNGITNGYDWYRVAGGRQDYATYFTNTREITMEISNTKLLSASLLPAHWNYNRNSLINYIETVLNGIKGTVTDTLGRPLKAKIEILSHDADNAFVFSDSVHGNYYRPIAQGTWTVKVSADSHYASTISNVMVNYNYPTELNVQLVPLYPPPVILQAPSGLTATAVNHHTARLEWTDNSDNEDGFVIERALIVPPVFFKIDTVAAGVTTFLDTTGVANTVFQYRVYAFKSIYKSGNSNTDTVYLPAMPIATPTNVTANAPSYNQVTLTWVDNAANETGFVIQRKIEGSTFANYDTLLANATTYNDTVVIAGAHYFYRLYAFNTETVSGMSDSTGVTVPYKPLTAPDQLSASLFDTVKVQITWHDNASDETGYQLERRMIPDTAFTMIAELPIDAIMYTDETVSQNKVYEYRVRAVRPPVFSDYSNTDTVYIPVVVGIAEQLIPTEFALLQNYPNPFNPSTVIAFDLPEKSDVNLTVFSSLGEEIATLQQGTVDAGRHSVSFNAEGLPSGIYFYRITAGKFTSVKKLMLVR